MRLHPYLIRTYCISYNLKLFYLLVCVLANGEQTGSDDMAKGTRYNDLERSLKLDVGRVVAPYANRSCGGKTKDNKNLQLLHATMTSMATGNLHYK